MGVLAKPINRDKILETEEGDHIESNQLLNATVQQWLILSNLILSLISYTYKNKIVALSMKPRLLFINYTVKVMKHAEWNTKNWD
jgi:hypothetical protein